MKGPALLLLKLAVTVALIRFAASLLYRGRFLPIGLLFGLVILLWHVRRLRGTSWWRCAGFLVAVSGVWCLLLLIYALDAQYGGPAWPVIVGFFACLTLFPCAHGLILGGSPARALLDVFAVPGTLWLISILWGWRALDEVFGPVSIVWFWQALHLGILFARWPPRVLVEHGKGV